MLKIPTPGTIVRQEGFVTDSGQTVAIGPEMRVTESAPAIEDDVTQIECSWAEPIGLGYGQPQRRYFPLPTLVTKRA